MQRKSNGRARAFAVAKARAIIRAREWTAGGPPRSVTAGKTLANLSSDRAHARRAVHPE